MLMAEEVQKNKSFRDRLKNTYRLVVMNNETFEEVGSYRLTLLNVYVLVCTMMVVVSVLVVSSVMFTPLKRLVPGYGTISNETEIFNLRQEIDTLSQALAAQQRYNESFRRLLVGEVQTVEDIPQIQYEPGDSSAQTERIEEDEALRRVVELEAIREINELNRSNSSNAPVPLEQIFFTPPVTGEISAGFMPDKGHQGVDILAPKNTPIKVVMDGVVIASDWTLETGNTIGILHENDIVTFYKHNSVLLKKVGNIVQAGEAVAIIGNTGTLTDGPHLHFELWYQGVPVDPEGYINFN